MNEQPGIHKKGSSTHAGNGGAHSGNGGATFSMPTDNPKGPVSHGASDKSVTRLVKDLATDITALFTKEVALAKSEVTHSLHEAKAGAVGVATGGSVLYAGFLFLLLAAVAGLATVVELWLAALIVGGVVAIIGFVMVQTAKKKLQPSSFTPEHTLNSLHKDRTAIKGATR